MSDFDPDHPHGHTTRDGRKARIICKDRKGVAPIVALLDHGDGVEVTATFTKEGWLYGGCGGPDSRNLINAPAPKRVVYVNVYEADDPIRHTAWTSRAEADAQAESGCIGCNRIELEPGRWDE